MKKAIAMCLIACMVMTGCGGSKGGAGEPQETVAGSDGQNVKIKDEIIFCQGNDLTTLDHRTAGEGIFHLQQHL